MSEPKNYDILLSNDKNYHFEIIESVIQKYTELLPIPYNQKNKIHLNLACTPNNNLGGGNMGGNTLGWDGQKRPQCASNYEQGVHGPGDAW